MTWLPDYITMWDVGQYVLTMVAGQVLYRNGRYTTLDYPKLRQEFREAARRLTGR